jgi:hypothetical protein
MMQACADIIADEKKLQGAANIGIACGADTRKMYDQPIGPDELGYHVSGIPFFSAAIQAFSPPATLWKRAIDYRALIRDALSAEYPLAVSGFVSQIWAAALDSATVPAPKPFTVSLTNWGQVAVKEQYGKLRVTGFYPLVNMSHAAYPVFIATTAGGKTTITLLTTIGAVDQALAHRLLQRTVALIREMLLHSAPGA